MTKRPKVTRALSIHPRLCRASQLIMTMWSATTSHKKVMTLFYCYIHLLILLQRGTGEKMTILKNTARII